MKRNTSAELKKPIAEQESITILGNFFRSVSHITVFTGRFFKEVVRPPYEFGEFAKQSYLIGNKSFVLIGITAFIMGLVLTIQSRPVLAEFGAQSWLPAMVAVSLVREIAPVITAVIFAGKVGSGIGAELASMRVTEQIEAMEVSGINPYKYIVVTRILAATCMLPILVAFADSIGLYGSYFGINLTDAVTFKLFFFHVFERLDFVDVFPAFIKTIVFGFFIGLISCYIGYNAGNGTEGVGKAANSAVVFSSLAVFVIDMIAVQITSFFM